MKEPHKRFLVFGYDTGDAGGGFEDFIDSFDTIEEVKELIEEDIYNWYEVYDRIAGKKILD